MSVKLFIQYNGKQLTLPINPEEIEVTRGNDNEEIDIVGLGKTVRTAPPRISNINNRKLFSSRKYLFLYRSKTCNLYWFYKRNME